MTTFTWNNLVQVRTGEMSRRGQLELSDSAAVFDEEHPELVDDARAFMRFLDDTFMRLATKEVRVCVNGEWVTAADPISFVHDEDTYFVGGAWDQAVINELPASLVGEWKKQAVKDNDYTYRMLFLASEATADSSQTTSESPSAAEPSSAHAKVRQTTKTIGDTDTPNTSSDGSPTS